jgi:hypothetical protein
VVRLEATHIYIVSLSLRKLQALCLKIIFESKKKGVTGEWRKLHHLERLSLYALVTLIMLIIRRNFSVEFSLHLGRRRQHVPPEFRNKTTRCHNPKGHILKEDWKCRTYSWEMHMELLSWKLQPELLNHFEGPGMGKKLRYSYPYKGPWRPIGSWDVEASISSRQSAHRWRESCQPYSPAALYLHEHSWYSFLLEAESTAGP